MPDRSQPGWALSVPAPKRKPQQPTAKRFQPPKVLVEIHADGFIELFSRTPLNVTFYHHPRLTDSEHPDAARLLDKLAERVLGPYWAERRVPINMRGHAPTACPPIEQYAYNVALWRYITGCYGSFPVF